MLSNKNINDILVFYDVILTDKT